MARRANNGFTERGVLTLPLSKRRHYDRQQPGLYVACYPITGTRSFRVAYTLYGHPDAMTLGRVEDIPLEKARERAKEIRQAAKAGQDPKVKPDAEVLRWGAVVRDYTQREAIGSKRLKSAAANEELVLRLTAAWHKRPIGSITRRHIKELLAVVAADTPYQAVRLHAHLKSILDWTVDMEWLAQSPMPKKPPVSGLKGRDREWFKSGRNGAPGRSDDVVKAVWGVANAMGGDDGRFLKLVLITGKRVNAVAAMRWDQIEEGGWWTPIEGSKNKRNNPTPLSRLAQRVLGSRPGKGGPVAVVSTRRRDTMKQHVRKKLEGVASDFILHGLRHILATWFRAQKVRPDIWTTPRSRTRTAVTSTPTSATGSPRCERQWRRGVATSSGWSRLRMGLPCSPSTRWREPQQ